MSNWNPKLGEIYLDCDGDVFAIIELDGKLKSMWITDAKAGGQRWGMKIGEGMFADDIGHNNSKCIGNLTSIMADVGITLRDAAFPKMGADDE